MSSLTWEVKMSRKTNFKLSGPIVALIALLAGLIFSAAYYALAGGDDFQGLSNAQPVDVSIPEGGGAAGYYIDVPEGVEELSFDLTISEGELDLYSAFEVQPTPEGEPCSAQSEDDEDEDDSSQRRCVYEDPAPGRWYVLVYGEAAGEASLTATYRLADEDEGDSDRNELDNDEWVGGKVEAGEAVYYYVDVPENTNFFKVDLHIVSGAPELYTRYGQAPSEEAYDCQSVRPQGNERCHHHFPQAGRWWVMVLGREDSRFSIKAHYTRNSDRSGRSGSDDDDDDGDDDGGGDHGKAGRKGRDEDRDRGRDR